MADTPRTNIFFAGTVHEAIAASVQQRLALVCFVTDAGEEASRWESEYLVDSEIFELLQSGAILLRLDAGSQEAALLADVCPVHEIPHLLVIKDGALLARLVSGASREEFTTSVKNALSQPPTAAESPDVASPSIPSPQYPAPVQPVSTSVTQQPSPPTYQAPAPAPAPARVATPSSGYPTTPQRERTPAPPVETGNLGTGRRPSIRPGSQSYIDQQRHKKTAEQAERQRILQLLENDKAERRLRERERRGEPATPTSSSARPSAHNPEVSKNQDVALSFRLVDGSNIKSRFPSSAVLGEEVRAWIDKNRTDGDHPYHFMEILGPSNNRPLTISDENLTVGSLFKRSATLVLVPTQSYTSVAYETAASAGTGLFSQAYGMISGAVSAIWNLSNFAPRTEEQPPPSRRGGERVGGGDDARRPGPSGSSQLRTLRDQSVDRDERKYYNGNQLSFEPKPDGN